MSHSESNFINDDHDHDGMDETQPSLERVQPCSSCGRPINHYEFGSSGRAMREPDTQEVFCAFCADYLDPLRVHVVIEYEHIDPGKVGEEESHLWVEGKVNGYPFTFHTDRGRYSFTVVFVPIPDWKTITEFVQDHITQSGLTRDPLFPPEFGLHYIGAYGLAKEPCSIALGRSLVMTCAAKMCAEKAYRQQAIHDIQIAFHYQNRVNDEQL